MKKIIQYLSIICFIFTLTITGLYANEDIRIDQSFISEGRVGIYFNKNTDKKIKLMIEKGKEKYTYNLKPMDKTVYFPLQMGNGKYQVKIYENTVGTKYKALRVQTIDVKLKNENIVFLQSVQEIDWTIEKKAIQLSEEILKKAEAEKGSSLTDSEKAKALYEYVIESIVYDYAKIDNLQYDYLPDIDKTVVESKGICYDYSSLYAAMLRNQGIPIKMAKGYSKYTTDVYHAWNEVFLADQNKWVIIDSTIDAGMKTNYFERPVKDYQKLKEL